MDELRIKLAQLGLSQKQAEVYLAMLMMGPSSAQDIAESSKVNRSTTYPVIEELKSRGLVSTFEKGGKTLFCAESPERLVVLLAEELSGLEARRSALDTCLPELLAVFNTRADKPKVRFFEGVEALAAVRRELVQSREPVWEVYAVDEGLKHIASLDEEARIKNQAQVLRGRALMALKPGCVPPYFDQTRFEARVMDYRLSPFTGDVAITGDRMCVIATKEKGGMGILIENKELTAIFRALFEAAWQCAGPWVPPEGWKK